MGKETLAGAGLGVCQGAAKHFDVKQCVELLLALPNEKRSLLAMLLNNLWWEINRVRGGESRSPQELAWLTWRQSEEFKELTKLHPGTRGNQQIPRWKRPPAGLLKINAGGFAQECGERSWGFIIREENGEVVLAGAGNLNHVYEARQAELMACIQGARAAQTLSTGCLQWVGWWGGWCMN